VNGPIPVAIPSLTTKRLLLRPVQPEDLHVYHSMIFADPDVMR
jgi:RimJ/RimL family protein N-acetyltransferase